MSTVEHTALARRWIEELWNTGNVDLVDEMYASHFVFNDEAYTIERYKELVANHHTAFPGGRGTIEYTIAEGDRAAIRVTFRGMHHGEFKGPTGSISATGRPVTWTEITVLRFVGRRIVEETTEINWLPVLQQLGAIPTREPADG